MNDKKIKIAFFGTPEFSAKILEKMKQEDFKPSLVIATPDKPKGRNLVLTPPATKIWAEKNNIDVLQPTKLRDPEFLNKMKETVWDLFVVASYGKIIPQDILDLPKYGTINVHPSLLPRLRGASPMQSAILKENETGMTIMLMDADMDHGPILKQKKATYIDKIKKEEALINFDDDPFWNYRKIQALQNLKPHFFAERNSKKMRVIIRDAKMENGELIITRVLPEGKKEMDYQ